MKQMINDKGYPCVSLIINGKTSFRRVHRVVAETFLPNPENKPCVNHKDRNRQNANVLNLEWVTHSENVRHSIENGGRIGYTRDNSGEKNPNAILNIETVEAIRDLYFNCSYSQNKLARIFKLNQSRISKIVNKVQW